MSDDQPDLDDVGIVLPATEKVFQFIGRLSPVNLLKFVDPTLRPRTVDAYVLIWILLEVVIASYQQANGQYRKYR
jgi:hypothetical protein